MTATKAPHARAHWHDAYDAQMALWRWYRTPGGLRWVRSCIAAAGVEVDDPNRELVVRLWDGEMGRLIDCDPLYVSPEMCELVEAARETFAPEPLLETDLVTPRGFLYFGRPVPMLDRYGNPLSIQAASWAREYASDTEEQAAQAMERLHSESSWRFGDRIRPAEMEALIAEGLMFPFGINITLYAERDHHLNVVYRNANPPEWAFDVTAGLPLVPFHACPWHFGQSYSGNEQATDGLPSGMAEWWKLLQTTFRLMQQRIAARHVERPHRAHRREAKRLGLDYEPEIVVVRLRREAGPRNEPTGEEANYSHRFIVSGHWRNQWYATEKLHRQIWIAPFVKGPEDKPLIVRPRRVYQWER